MAEEHSWAGSNSYFFRLASMREEEVVRLTHQLIADGFVVEAAGENWLFFVRLEAYGDNVEKEDLTKRAGFKYGRPKSGNVGA